MLEEFEAIRNELQSSMNIQSCPMQRTTEHLTLLCAKFENDISHLARRQDYVENHINKMNHKDYSNDIEAIKGQVLSNKEDYKSLYDQMSDIINSMNEEISIVKTDQENSTQAINNIKSSINDLHQGLKLSSKFGILSEFTVESMMLNTNSNKEK